MLLSVIFFCSNATDLSIPDRWRPEVQQMVDDKTVHDSGRSAICRVLVDLLFTRATKPTRFQCEAMARRLILKYPFLRDTAGVGYVSL